MKDKVKRRIGPSPKGTPTRCWAPAGLHIVVHVRGRGGETEREERSEKLESVETVKKGEKGRLLSLMQCADMAYVPYN